MMDKIVSPISRSLEVLHKKPPNKKPVALEESPTFWSHVDLNDKVLNTHFISFFF